MKANLLNIINLLKVNKTNKQKLTLVIIDTLGPNLSSLIDADINTHSKRRKTNLMRWWEKKFVSKLWHGCSIILFVTIVTIACNSNWKLKRFLLTLSQQQNKKKKKTNLCNHNKHANTLEQNKTLYSYAS